MEADLEYLYRLVFLEYKPEIKAEEKRRRGRPVQLQLKLGGALRKLRDTKLFIKVFISSLDLPFGDDVLSVIPS